MPASGSGSDLLSLTDRTRKGHSRSASSGGPPPPSGSHAVGKKSKLKLLSSQVLKLQDMVLAYQDKYQSIRVKHKNGGKPHKSRQDSVNEWINKSKRPNNP